MRSELGVGRASSVSPGSGLEAGHQCREIVTAGAAGVRDGDREGWLTDLFAHVGRGCRARVHEAALSGSPKVVHGSSIATLGIRRHADLIADVGLKRSHYEFRESGTGPATNACVADSSRAGGAVRDGLILATPCTLARAAGVTWIRRPATRGRVVARSRRIAAGIAKRVTHPVSEALVRTTAVDRLMEAPVWNEVLDTDFFRLVALEIPIGTHELDRHRSRNREVELIVKRWKRAVDVGETRVERVVARHATRGLRGVGAESRSRTAETRQNDAGKTRGSVQVDGRTGPTGVVSSCGLMNVPTGPTNGETAARVHTRPEWSPARHSTLLGLPPKLESQLGSLMFDGYGVQTGGLSNVQL